MAKFVKTFECNTQYCADSVEWCPIEGFKHMMACGTYELKTNCGNNVEDGSTSNLSSKRLGKLYLFRLSVETGLLKEVQTLEIAAILDMKWSRFQISGKVLLAVATASGEVIIYELQGKLIRYTEIPTSYFQKL